jgi:hypothetical protein
MTITIYHNPSCGTSRNVLALGRSSSTMRAVDGVRFTLAAGHTLGVAGESAGAAGHEFVDSLAEAHFIIADAGSTFAVNDIRLAGRACAGHRARLRRPAARKAGRPRRTPSGRHRFRGPLGFNPAGCAGAHGKVTSTPTPVNVNITSCLAP